MTRRRSDPFRELPAAPPFDEWASLFEKLVPAAAQSKVMLAVLMTLTVTLIDRLSQLSPKYGAVSFMELSQLLATWESTVQKQSPAEQFAWMEVAAKEMTELTKHLRGHGTTPRSLIETPRVKLALARLGGSPRPKGGSTRPHARELWLDEYLARRPRGRPRKGRKGA